ncbi:hypothetical protein [Croceicoccus mobilis]|uniref:Uncharacterized protein n=1 Tax=Croceicoccus mobilis TaxID=1703339 RepID=A0A916YXP6_9SPHN|nr:hypothetical protein [Croceicoccus mobilis]GGD65967.1 hypothetical protein GCM10010990_14330 [Croceicoccus mobilis]
MEQALADEQPEIRGTARERQASWLFGAINVVAAILLQKFGLPAGSSAIQLVMPIYFASLGLAVFGLKLQVHPTRLLLYGLMAGAMLLSQMLTMRPTDVTAIALVLVLYAPMVLIIRLDEDVYRRILSLYQWLMILAVALVFGQHAVQFTLGYDSWPDLENFPPALLFPGYNYINEFGYQSPYVKPNGIVFLEPSFLSQFLAIALVIELVVFRRIVMMAAFVAGLFATMAGTGLLILALSSPFIISRVPVKMIAAGALVLVAVGGVAASVGWMDTVGDRVGEFSRPGTSGYNRYIRPILRVSDLVEEPERVVVGHGAGSAPYGQEGDDTVPLTKMFDEYGLIATLLLLLLMIHAMFVQAPSVQIAAIVFFYYNLGGGGLSVPIYVLFPAVLCANMRLTGPLRSGQSAQRVEKSAITGPFRFAAA